jgi:hypothetical protein
MPSFWKAYSQLDPTIQQRARKAYQLWLEDPFHPSLHFKCVQKEERLWSIRVSLDFRALGIIEDGDIYWYWIGPHTEYDKRIF